MRLTEIKKKLTQSATAPGLLTGAIEYEIKGGSSSINWIGPKIPIAVWHEVLPFFKWTYDTHKSESQVRLYVNPTLKIWTAWAFPQKAESYAATKEVENDDAAKQREQFKDSEGWMYLGTAHHHCGMSAFQSHTDRTNETCQDGLHVTVGNLNQARYDIHARFYLAGCEFLPDMAQFWDVGDEVRKLIPLMAYDAAARHQMTEPAPAPAEGARPFPAQWEANIIKDPPKTWESNGAGFQNGNGARGVAVSGSGSSPGSTHEPFWQRKQNAMKMIRGLCGAGRIIGEEMDATFGFFETDPVAGFIIKAAEVHHLDVDDIVREWRSDMDMAEVNGQPMGWEHLGG